MARRFSSVIRLYISTMENEWKRSKLQNPFTFLTARAFLWAWIIFLMQVKGGVFLAFTKKQKYKL